MVFNVKRIFRIASDKHGRKEQQQTDTDSPSEDDVYSQRIRNGSSNRPWASASSTSLWNSSRSKNSQQQQNGQNGENGQNQQSDNSSTRGVRKKASRIGRSKDSGGYADNDNGKESKVQKTMRAFGAVSMKS
jgi:hypothetical protein